MWGEGLYNIEGLDYAWLVSERRIDVCVDDYFFTFFDIRCHTCNGKGKIIKKHCHICHGNLTVETLENIVVYIERGIGS